MDPIRKTMHRYEIAGHARFLTFSCDQRQPFFDNRFARDVFADQLMLARCRYEFRLFAWVVMPEHIHLLVQPDLAEACVSKILMSLKRRVATRVLRSWRDDNRKAPRKFWQAGGGYDRNIYSSEELNEKLRYIHDNPVRRGLVDRQEDWAWSSCRAWKKLETAWAEIDRI